MKKNKTRFSIVAIIVVIAGVIIAYNNRAPETTGERILFALAVLFIAAIFFFGIVMPAVYNFGNATVKKTMEKLDEKYTKETKWIKRALLVEGAVVTVTVEVDHDHSLTAYETLAHKPSKTPVASSA